MAGSMIATLLLMGAVLTALSWLLYQKRPSEATGKALVYPISQPILKAYLMFIVAIGAGMVFSLAGSKLFFLLRDNCICHFDTHDLRGDHPA